MRRAPSMGFALREKFWLYETSGDTGVCRETAEIPGGFPLRPALRAAVFCAMSYLNVVMDHQ